MKHKNVINNAMYELEEILLSKEKPHILCKKIGEADNFTYTKLDFFPQNITLTVLDSSVHDKISFKYEEDEGLLQDLKWTFGFFGSDKKIYLIEITSGYCEQDCDGNGDFDYWNCNIYITNKLSKVKI